MTSTPAATAASPVIQAQGPAATIVNAGTIYGFNVGLRPTQPTNYWAVKFGSVNGLLDNNAGKLIEGYGGVYMAGVGTITNAGTIRGSAGGGSQAFGVSLAQGGTITNSGTIDVTGGGGNAVVMSGAGYINNAAGGKITSGTGVNDSAIRGSAASETIVNAGLIDSSGAYGILLAGGGTVTNAAAAGISGDTFGVRVTNAVGVVTNSGTIQGHSSNSVGIDLVSGGTLTNLGTASQIYGGSNGAILGVSAGTGVVTNHGTIVGVRAFGVYIGPSGGTITNSGTASLITSGYGIAIIGTGTLLNQGTVTATKTRGGGVNFYGAAGTVSNSGTAAHIVGAKAGIIFGNTGTATVGTVGNDGTIQGQTNAGIAMYGGGTIGNHASGLIEGATAGVKVAGGTAQITNSGTIEATGTAGNGVLFSGTGNGTIVNSGTILGGSGGVGITGSGVTIVNSGSVSGGLSGGTTRANAIEFTGGSNSLELQAGSAISGNIVGDAGSTNTLILSGDVTQSSGAGATVFDASQIQGFSAFQKTGLSTWTLTNSTTGTTPWTISAGTLQVGDGTTNGSIVGPVTDNATLAFDPAAGTTVTNSGVISGSGVVNLIGPGTTVLSAANTYSGSTTIKAGTLDVAATGSIGSTASPTSDVTIATGATFENAGTVVTNTLTNDGIVTVGAGGVLTANTGIANNGTFTNDGTVNDDLVNTSLYTNNGTENANVASNTGTIVNSAGATWNGNFNTAGIVDNEGTIVSAANGYVQTAGTTTNNGTISGPVTVSGGLFTGVGSSGSVTIGSGATFAPGSGVAGTAATVNGNLTLSAGSTYRVNVDPSAASLANVSGTATLTGSTVNAVYANGSYVAKQYTILSATGGVKGIFSGLTNTNLPANFTDSLSYDASHAYLDLVLNFTPGQSYGQGLNGNQRNVANALINAFNANGGIPTVFGTLSQAGLTQVSGELATAAQRATFDAMDQFMGTMTDPTVAGWGVCDGPSGTDRSQPGSPSATGCGADHVSVWGAAYGGSRSTNGNPATGSSDTTSDVEGVAAGASYRFSADTVAGVSLGGGGTNFSLANGLGSGRSSLVQAGAFIHHTMGAAYVGGSLAWGWQDFTTNRTVTVAGADQLRARFDANALSGRLESGWRFGAGSVSLTPYAAAQFTSLFLPSYSEQAQAGANTFALDYGSKTATEVRSELGLRVGKSFDVSGGLVTLGGRLAWSHSFNPTPTATAGFQTLPGTAFTVSGASVGSDAALTSVLAGIAWNNGWSLGARFDGAFSAKSRSYDGKVTVSYKW